MYNNNGYSNYNNNYNNNNNNYNNYNNVYNNGYNYNNNLYNQHNYNQNNGYESILNDNYNNEKINNEKNRNFSIKKILIIIIIIVLIVVIFIIARNLLKSYTMSFKLNGADEIANTELNCKSNIKGECFLTLPDVKRTNGEVIGYSDNPDSKEAQYKIGDKVKMDEDMILYVISKRKLKLNIDKTDINEVRDSNTGCEIYNTENSCNINIPMFNKNGYQIDGYTKDKSNSNDLILLGSKYKLTDNLTLYPVYSEFKDYTYTKNIHFNIEKSIYINNTYLDVGYNCSDSIVSSLTNNMNKLYNSFPFYAYYSKVILLSDSEFVSFANNNRDIYGLTDEKNIDNPMVIIRCSENLSSYITTVHELSHALDIRYKKLYGHYMNEEKEIIELRNKYANSKTRPLRSYAYSDKSNTSVPEFFAELITYYYINYIDTTSDIGINYKRGNYPDDMKKMAEKYLCIGRNDYDKTKCS